MATKRKKAAGRKAGKQARPAKKGGKKAAKKTAKKKAGKKAKKTAKKKTGKKKSAMAAMTPLPCKYQNVEYATGTYLCIQGKCKQCQNGNWVDTNTNCAPGQDGQPCNP